jgi:uncharacterized protein (DUF488 family)
MAQYTVYTVGHGELSWDEFALLLKPYHIEVLVDTRSFPYCHDTPWFNRDRLEHLVRREGLEYLWLGARLGPLTEDGRVDYLAKEAEGRYRQGIQQLLTLAHERCTCLLGSQLDPLVSHRHHLIAQTLLRHDVGVKHILADGDVTTAYADLFHGWE